MAPLSALAVAPAEPPADVAVEQAVLRLAGEFGAQVRPQVIVRVVRNCRRDLGGSPVGALPELVERLARHRLQQSIS
jgi:hypothetical protein